MKLSYNIKRKHKEILSAERVENKMNEEKIWETKTRGHKAAWELSQELGLSPLLAELLLQRGIDTCEEARYFLNAGPDDLQSPFLLTGIEPAAARVRKAVGRGEKIAVYGDYDVDGVCAAAMLKQALERLGAAVEYYLPDRFSEGYGLNRQAVEKIAAQGCKLLITVDCGITSVFEAQAAQDLGMDLIISDHHTPGTRLPPALAIINPKLDDIKELKELCGAGVAFKLCQALCPHWALDKNSGWLEIAALATVADVVELKGENRILVKHGLLRLPETVNGGLRALLRESGLEGRSLSSWHIGFILAPLLNSAGRLRSARSSVELLLSRDAKQAKELAVLLCDLNNERKTIEETVCQEALRQVGTELDPDEEPVLVLGGEGWHQGVIGIAASRLCEKYRRPVIMISWEGEQGRGSCRSLPGLDICQALSACASHLLQFGGHQAAAGLTINRADFGDFCQALRQWVKDNASGEKFASRLIADAELEPAEINDGLLQELARLEPFGAGNPAPRFIIRGVEVDAAVLLGRQKKHFRARLGLGGTDLIAFNRPDLIERPLDVCLQDILFQPENNDFRGIKKVRLKISDMKNSCRPDDQRAVNDYGRGLLRAVHKAVAEIYAGRPVLFIFPTYRALIKHKPLILSLIRPSALRELHGCLNGPARRGLTEEFIRGRNRLFLTTAAFERYYRRGCRPPEKINYIFTFYPRPPVREMEEYYDDCVITSLQDDGRPGLITGKAEIDPARRVFLYVNRNTTLHALAERENLKIEAGINDIRQRNIIRRRFIQSGGILLSDGAHTGLAGLDKTDVFLVDSPYSLYEAQTIMNQLAAGEEKKAAILFEPRDLEFNRRYLERRYPDIELLRGARDYFRAGQNRPLTADIGQISSALGDYLQKKCKPADLMGILASMADLGLCGFTKKGNIMTINFIQSDKIALDLSQSPYHLEGQAEKKAFGRWESELNNILSW